MARSAGRARGSDLQRDYLYLPSNTTPKEEACLVFLPLGVAFSFPPIPHTTTTSSDPSHTISVAVLRGF